MLLLMERAGALVVVVGVGAVARGHVPHGMGWPAFIAPLFNRFSPLEDAALKARIEALLERCGFASKGVFVVDNSRRSSHGNAYFTGIGRHKRIVFFDTLLERLAPPEVEAVLAHELGHFRLQPRAQARCCCRSPQPSSVWRCSAGWRARPDFYAALGVPRPSTHAALLLFVLAVPAFTFFVTPLASLWSRRHEFEADAFATRYASAAELATALVKLHRDNASTLTPDPVYAAFYYSHPAPLTRITRLRAAAATTPQPAEALRPPCLEVLGCGGDWNRCASSPAFGRRKRSYCPPKSLPAISADQLGDVVEVDGLTDRARRGR